jgi:hypothetical protein
MCGKILNVCMRSLGFVTLKKDVKIFKYFGNKFVFDISNYAMCCSFFVVSNSYLMQFFIECCAVTTRIVKCCFANK